MNRSSTTVPFATQLDVDLTEALRVAAFEEGRSMNEILEELVRQHLPHQYLVAGRDRAARLQAEGRMPARTRIRGKTGSRQEVAAAQGCARPASG
ncbi:ribbon-helix-helix protein, CopG family [Muricoccus vinaceus]|uniref:Ribbon-helix-helix protein, CopG family n=1 Tax=Muricoccus vinaceus TaxID=424704 RepID=A0ABV6IZT0_9PROT